MLHWEDFGDGNARRILNKYADQVCAFNDDRQGTAAVVLAAVFSAVRGLGIADMMRDVMIDEGLSRGEATQRFYALGSRDLLVDDSPKLRDFQMPYARPAAEVAGWSDSEVAPSASPTLYRTCGPPCSSAPRTQAGAFTEGIVRQMARYAERPIIMPLFNPTSKCEALPEDLLRWTDGRALIATGSPFPPVTFGETTYRIAQANNALIFPGLGLEVIVAKARRITDPMIAAAANALAHLPDATRLGAPLLPAVDDLRAISAMVGIAVAVAADREGLAQIPVDNPIQQVHEAMWRPEYPRLELEPS